MLDKKYAYSGHNVAVFEIEAIKDGETRYVYIGAYSEGGGLHSEEIIDQVIKKYSREGWGLCVTRIYSERDICSECMKLIGKDYFGSKLSSTVFNDNEMHDAIIRDYIRELLGESKIYKNGLPPLKY